jgi:hypothetical protein
MGIIDEEGKRTKKGHDVFVLGDDAFPSAFEGLVREAYKDLFDLRGDEAWTINKNELTSYFRTTDKTSEVIGARQANVFQMFRAVAGRDQVVEKSNTKPKLASSKLPPQKRQKMANVNAAGAKRDDATENDSRKNVALTVRIEINLPANGSQETYDNIFRSIRANLINE